MTDTTIYLSKEYKKNLDEKICQDLIHYGIYF